MTETRTSGPRRVGELLTAAVPALAERMLEAAIRREWVRTVGPELGRRSRPGELRRGVLEVQADNSPWLQELNLRSGELLARLSARYGGAVSSLRFSLATTAPPPSDGQARIASSRPGPAPRLSPEETREVETLASTLEDPALAGALRRLLIKDRLARRARGGTAPPEGGPR